MSKVEKKSGSSKLWYFVIPVIIAVLIPIYRVARRDPIAFVIPNFIAMTSYRDTAIDWWTYLIKKHLDTTKVYEPTHIPEMQAEDYTFEALREMTKDFRYPAVVRGLLKDAPAMTLWNTSDYLPSRLGHYKIPVVRENLFRKAKNLGDRFVTTFAEVYKELLSDKESKMYIFFPIHSRFETNGSDASTGSNKKMMAELNEIAQKDLLLDRIWKGYGTVNHAGYKGAQFIVGQGTASENTTTGTGNNCFFLIFESLMLKCLLGWHCAIGNNWFAQVFGRKRWWFLDPIYSPYMHPVKNGRNTMQTGNFYMQDIAKHLPLQYVDLNPGDLLYNPDWYWHTIQNYDGFAFGVPMRELNITNAIRNNAHFTSIAVTNLVLDTVGIDAGYAPPMKTNKDFQARSDE